MTLEKAIDTLNQKFPGCEAAPSEDFDGSKDGIWFRNSEEYCLSDEMPMFDMYLHTDSFGTHPDFEAALNRLGFSGCACDNGTMLAYPN